MLKNTDMITVCDHCLTACCWQGLFYCDNYKTAGTIDKSVGELRKLNLEHPNYWKEAKSFWSVLGNKYRAGITG